MKQVIPFQKELLFKTKVSEVTSISLEHSISSIDEDLVSGEFLIFGDYKMTEGSINREKFSFQLPFDIALDSKYLPDTVVVDIDNFYYEVVNNESLKVNIDVYVMGEKQEEKVKDVEIEEVEKEDVEVIKEEDVRDSKVGSDDESLELEPDINYEKVDNHSLEVDDFNIFDQMDSADTYVTYYVYIVKEDDTLDKILEKYQVTREDVSLYNDLDSIKPGVKLIIPSKNG